MTPEPGSSDPAEVLDDRSTVERLDPHGLLARIEALPDQCEAAWQRADGLSLPESHAEARDVVVLGMGGSAIAGAMLGALSAVSGTKPVRVLRGYDLPPYVDQRSLVIACSHSGDTEETLSAFQQALAAGARTAALTTGGRLRDLAGEAGAPVFAYTYAGEPRSAIGHQLMTLLALGERSGALGAQSDNVAAAIALMRDRREELVFDSPAERNPAKQLAGRLHGRLAVVVGTGALTPAAYRWKTQLNENAKSWALAEELPEFDHNGIAGLGLPAGAPAMLYTVFLQQQGLDVKMLRRIDATAEELSAAGVANERVAVPGADALSQLLAAVQLGDFVSYYLALLNGVEPSPVAALDRVKKKLSDG